MHHVHSSPLWNAHSQAGKKTMEAEMIKAILKYALGFYRIASSSYLKLYLKMELANPKPLNKNKILNFLKLF